MIEVGWEQLVEGGIRSLRVERVAAAVGIAKGTFYHFFDSKDDFIYAMLMENRQHAMDVLERVREEAGAPLDRACMRSWLELLWRSERNIFRIATAEEYRYLVRSLPSERTLDPASDARSCVGSWTRLPTRGLGWMSLPCRTCSSRSRSRC